LRRCMSSDQKIRSDSIASPDAPAVIMPGPRRPQGRLHAHCRKPYPHCFSANPDKPVLFPAEKRKEGLPAIGEPLLAFLL
jgi:hypothetical protein